MSYVFETSRLIDLLIKICATTNRQVLDDVNAFGIQQANNNINATNMENKTPRPTNNVVS